MLTFVLMEHPCRHVCATFERKTNKYIANGAQKSARPTNGRPALGPEHCRERVRKDNLVSDCTLMWRLLLLVESKWSESAIHTLHS